MVLFPSLNEFLETESTSTATSASSSKMSSSVEPCTVLQLFTDVGLDFWRDEIKYPLEPRISYHAVCATMMDEQQDAANTTRLPGAHHQKKTDKLLVPPNLGVWNVPITQSHILNNSSTSTMIQPKNTTFLWTLDLSKPHDLTSIIQSYQNATCSYFNTASSQDDTSSFSYPATTFGQAPNAADSNNSAKCMPWAKHQLILVAVVPLQKNHNSNNNKNQTTTFQEKQTQCFLHYHLHKFAAQVGATLIFCSANDQGTTTTNENDPADNTTTTTTKDDGMSITDLLPILHQLCQKQQQQQQQPSTAEEEIILTNEFVNVEFDKDVIDSAMLRNASCPGLWDANTQSLDDVFSSLNNVAASAEQKESNKNSSKKSSPAAAAAVSSNTQNDQWLQTLADSMRDIHSTSSSSDAKDDKSVVSTSTKKSSTSRKSMSSKSGSKKSSSKASASAAPTNDADVGSFFADLLKKS